MQNCLVVCATKQQSACDVAAEIANDLRLRGVAVDLECSRHVSSLDGYDTVVIGAPLCHGRWRRSTRRFLRRHQATLQGTDVALFALGPCADGQQAYDRSWNRLVKMLQRLAWLDPVRIEVFSDRALPYQQSCYVTSETSPVARWCRGLAVAMHLTDHEAPHQRGGR